MVAELETAITRRFFWTDSRNVLGKLRNDPSRYNTFVANRLGELDELTNVPEWRWIPSTMNVADDATRCESKFKATSRWLEGPEILFEPETNWPVLSEVPHNKEICNLSG